jgi:signal peptidase II
MTRRVAAGLIMAALMLAADQASKYWMLHGLDLPDRGEIAVIPGFFDFAMVFNKGVTFGLFRAGNGAGQAILIAVAVAVTAGLLAWLRRAETLFLAICLGAIAGGALGNVADRFRYGRVVDFIHLHAGAWDPFPFVFNVGDSAIVLGVTALLIEGLLPSRRRLQPPPPSA